MKKDIKLKSSIIFLLIILLLNIINDQLVDAQDNWWRSPMLGTLNGPVVIFKADDYYYNCNYLSSGIPCENTNWGQFFNIIRNDTICADINVITGWTTWNVGAPERIIELHQEMYLNSLNDNVIRFDFLNHSDDHANMTGKNYEEQYHTIKISQDTFHNILGFDSHGFAAPGNGINQTTLTVFDDYNINNNDLLTMWINYGFGAIDFSRSRYRWNFIVPFEYGPDYSHLLFGVTLSDFHDNGVCILETENFKSNYNTVYSKNPFIIMEIHPASWSDQSAFDAFTEMIAFLKSKNAFFVTPTYIYNKANDEHYCGDYYGADDVNAMSSLSAGSSFQCPYTIVHNGANVSFTASKEINLLPGFNVEKGSSFDASIVPQTSLKSQSAEKTKLLKVESDEHKVNIYPNPSDGVFTIDFGDQQTNSSSIIITDLYGHEIKKINTTCSKETIDLSNQPSGIYTVQVLSNKCFSKYKIVKE